MTDSGPSEDTYQTLATAGEGLYKEKGSKFYSYALPVADAAQVKSELETLRQLHHTSRHVCYGYVLGQESEVTRSNDAGEPANTAGKPILNQIQTRDLTNSLVVVVRYFGGTKLGVSGLIHAYRVAAEEALDQATVKVQVVGITFDLLFDYPQMSDVMRILREENLQVQDPQFNSDCRLHIWVRKNRVDSIVHRLGQIHKLQVIARQ